MTTAMSIASAFCGLMILLTSIWIVFALRIAYTKMDLILDLLKYSTAVRNRTFFRNLGPWGHIILIGSIAGIVTSPGFFLKHGGVCSEELNNFPAPLKKTLAILYKANILLVFTLILSVVIAKTIQILGL